MILLIDNFDSFTYNVFQLVGQINPDIRVVRNNAVTISDIEDLAPTHIIISPGPGFPVTAGISIAAIRHFAGKIPILGICLGHQAIAEAFGAVIIHAPELVHGKKRPVRILFDSSGKKALCPLFDGLPETLEVARYHSLSADPATIPDCLLVTATAPDDTVMGIMHRDYPVYGVQFHPESILTEYGRQMMENFLR
ncbi:MAG: aminodeoxychorismate/anthranilate synthase component II [Eubacteriales bacterium]